MAYANIISHNLDMIRAAGREGATIRAAKIAAIKAANFRIAVQRNLGNFFVVLAEMAEIEMAKQTASATPDFSALFALTCGDYQKWLRKAIRQFGRNAVVGNAQHSPVDMFVKERTGLNFLLLASDEIEVTIGNETYHFMSATSMGYYLFDDESGEMVVTTAKALDVAMYQDASTLIVG